MVNWIEEHQKDVDKFQKKIDEIDERLTGESSNRKIMKLEKEKEKFISKRDRSQHLKDRIVTGEINDTKGMKFANKMDSIGNKMQSTGKAMTKAGLHTTAAVWTPAIYLGYQAVKQSRKQPKNESVEQDLIELINEVEQAHKEGKITEDEKRGHIINFVDEFYKK